ncbi:DUF3592 domain-containing protein [Motiliproteus sp. MSK22-1]|uniref:DUF3592 domain-containing protein n=1 Tax=Motiliproteus sp. MSK22-1 TaxID=1897630 RepID=UPI0013017461|nr:DUF3592 domain-containing protein [Motiliproteus sp. MSK22-1]
MFVRFAVGLVFGFAFTGGGLLILSETAWPMLVDWHSMQKWQPTNAFLLNVSGGSNYIKARYQYQFNGRSYSGNRVYVAEVNDNIGSYHKYLFARLKKEEGSNEPIIVWVDPQNPEQSVIDRNMRWGLFTLESVFCSIFIVIGLLIAYASIRSEGKKTYPGPPSLSELRKEWEQKLDDPHFGDSFIAYKNRRLCDFEESSYLATENDKKPATKIEPLKTNWRDRYGWKTSSIRSTSASRTLLIWLVGLFWIGITSPALIVIPDELGKENYAVLLVLLFPLVGLFILYKAVVKTLEYQRFGNVVFKMDPYPGAIGGHIGGTVHVSQLSHGVATDQAASLAVRLECVYSYVPKTGKNRSRQETITWCEEGAPKIEPLSSGVNLIFRFDVPDNLPESDIKQSGSYHFWRLTIKSDIQGADLDREFNIPAFHSREASRTVKYDISAQGVIRKQQELEVIKDSISQGDFDVPGLSRAMRFRIEGDGIYLFFPMLRNRLLSLILAIFSGGFGLAGYSILGSAFTGGWIGILLGLFSVPFVLIAVIAIIGFVFLTFNSLRVDITPDQISVLRRLLFFPVYWRQLPVSDISHLELKCSGSTSGQGKKTEHFRILIHDNLGNKMAIAEDIDGREVATHFCQYLRCRLNLKPDNKSNDTDVPC